MFLAIKTIARSNHGRQPLPPNFSSAFSSRFFQVICFRRGKKKCVPINLLPTSARFALSL